MKEAFGKRKNSRTKTMQPYTHLIPYQDRTLLYLNGTMKCILLTPKEQSDFCAGAGHPQLLKLLDENERMYHQRSERRKRANVSSAQ